MASHKEKFDLPSRFSTLNKSNIWEEYIVLAQKYKPVDLGQGFPDFSPPQHIKDALTKVVNHENVLLHQYTRGCGHLRLVNVLGKLYSQLLNRNIDPLKEVVVTAGAYGGLYCSLIGHVDVGDEVIIIEPFFDCYQSMVQYAGGICKFVPLRSVNSDGNHLKSGDWKLHKEELENAFTPKTKAIILNTPNNPLGKVYTREELDVIAELCKKWNVLCIADEVYEWLVYDCNTHVRMASLPGMWERTITIGSGGKTFSVTGWKAGWAYGSEKLIKNVQMAHLNSVYVNSTPIQEAIAIGFETELERLGKQDCYFNALTHQMSQNKDYMVEFLKNVGMKPIDPEGGYFVLADWSALESEINLGEEKDEPKDIRFTKWMTKNVGVQGIPPSVFYSEQHKHLAQHLVRFCFIKDKHKLEQAANTLKKWREKKI